jgi:hypothetical protein
MFVDGKTERTSISILMDNFSFNQVYSPQFEIDAPVLDTSGRTFSAKRNRREREIQEHQRVE